MIQDIPRCKPAWQWNIHNFGLFPLQFATWQSIWCVPSTYSMFRYTSQIMFYASLMVPSKRTRKKSHPVLEDMGIQFLQWLSYRHWPPYNQKIAGITTFQQKMTAVLLAKSLIIPAGGCFSVSWKVVRWKAKMRRVRDGSRCVTRCEAYMVRWKMQNSSKLQALVARSTCQFHSVQNTILGSLLEVDMLKNN